MVLLWGTNDRAKVGGTASTAGLPSCTPAQGCSRSDSSCNESCHEGGRHPAAGSITGLSPALRSGVSRCRIAGAKNTVTCCVTTHAPGWGMWSGMQTQFTVRPGQVCSSLPIACPCSRMPPKAHADETMAAKLCPTCVPRRDLQHAHTATLGPGDSRSGAVEAGSLHSPVPSTADAAQLAQLPWGAHLQPFLMGSLHLRSRPARLRWTCPPQLHVHDVAHLLSGCPSQKCSARHMQGWASAGLGAQRRANRMRTKQGLA